MSMNTFAKLASLLPLLSLAAACQPEFDNRFSAVDAPRVLAVRSSPAEAGPNGTVEYRTLIAGQDGEIADSSITWTYCTQAKPINELNDVAKECFSDGDFITPIGEGTTVTGTIPSNACRQFGPDIPQTKPGQPPGRPIDADSSGGYYQPVILAIDAQGEGISTLAETRINCGLANSNGGLAEEYRLRTKLNENPELSAVVATSLNGAVLSEDPDAPLSVQRSELLELRASWPNCPAEPVCGDGICSSGELITTCADDCTTPVGCKGPEEYAYLNPGSAVLSERHEAMRVSWFASGGNYRDDHTGRAEDEYQNATSDNRWRAPSTPGIVHLWVVLRDARGGVDWKSFFVSVE